MKYIAILRQEGGCDYTIGCGINTVQFEANTTKEAAEKLRSIVTENYASDEGRLKSVQFFEILNTYEVDVDLWYKKIDDARILEKQNAEIQKELAELERLKKKYNQ